MRKRAGLFMLRSPKYPSLPCLKLFFVPLLLLEPPLMRHLHSRPHWPLE